MRAAWRVIVAQVLESSRRLVVVDECGTHTSLVLVYSYSPCGERTHCSVPRNRGEDATLIASITLERMSPCVAVEGTIDKAVFEADVEQIRYPP